MIAGYYKDTHIAPTSMRHAMGYSACGGTDAPHGERGLQFYGVPASWGQLTTAQLILKLNQDIPVDIAVVYGKIPRNHAYIQDMNFYGLHSVVACKRTRNSAGTLGILVRDPDRWGTGKVNYVFWPDSVWIPAWAAAKYVAVWPDKPKVISAPAPIYPYSAYRYSKKLRVNPTEGLWQRSAPSVTSKQEVLRPKGYVFTSFLRTDKGGVYTVNGVKKTSWVAWRDSNGHYHWLAAAYLSVL
jgi:hypothetical protein